MATWRGMAGVHLFAPADSAPMTKEQSIRGPDAVVGWMVLATGYDGEAVREACERHIGKRLLEQRGVPAIDWGSYEMNFTATAAEVSRTPANRTLAAAERQAEGPRG